MSTIRERRLIVPSVANFSVKHCNAPCSHSVHLQLYLLGFPCPTCMEHATDTHVQPSAVLHCPLVQVRTLAFVWARKFTTVQNAGCGHLHHAHCLRMGSDDAPMASCPSGCPRGTFPREAAIFDPPTPHIIVAWDGDKIDYVPIPAPQGGFAQSTPLRLTSDEVVTLIRNFLSSKGFALPGLFLRIHSRDATTEYGFGPHLCVWKLMCC